MNRKHSFWVALLMAISCLITHGQESGGGGLSVEFTGSPFSSSSLLSPGNIRAKFVTGPLGFRLGFTTSMTNEQIEPETTIHIGYFDLRPGFEFHTSLGKASPYGGVELIVMNQSANRNSTVELGVANATSRNGANQAFIGFGGGLFAGLDYYWGERFYVGMEVGVEAYNQWYKDVTMAGEVLYDYRSRTAFTLQSNLSNTFKLGFTF